MVWPQRRWTLSEWLLPRIMLLKGKWRCGLFLYLGAWDGLEPAFRYMRRHAER